MDKRNHDFEIFYVLGLLVALIVVVMIRRLS